MIENNTAHFKINKKLKLILIGMLLGDANLQTFSKGKTARLRILHSTKQAQYIEHKYQLFQPIIRTKILTYSEKETGYKKMYFNTITTSQLKFYYDLFYQQNRKIVPRNIHRYLQPITLAYWYMDDGSLKWKNRSKAVRLCTDNFSEKEVTNLVEALNKKYSWLSATVQKQRSRYRIYIPNNDYQFSKLIEPFIIDSMKYKLPTENNKIN